MSGKLETSFSREQARASLDDYLKGRPLTPELARLQAGEDDTTEPAEPAEEQASGVLRKPLDDGDREHLRRLALEPGWPILLNLLDSRIAQDENASKEASMAEPFDPANATRWSKVGALKEARHLVVALLRDEVRKLEQRREEQEDEA